MGHFQVKCFLLFKRGELAEQGNVYVPKHNKAILSLGKQPRHLSYLMQLHRMMGEKYLGGGKEKV